MAFLRCCVPARSLGFVSRLALAPGLTVAFCVLLFTWCDVFGLKLTPLAPWILMAAALLSQCLRFRNGKYRVVLPLVSLPRRALHRIFLRRWHRLSVGVWLPNVVLVALLAMLLVVRFRSTWGWSVPPGIDSPQHRHGCSTSAAGNSTGRSCRSSRA